MQSRQFSLFVGTFSTRRTPLWIIVFLIFHRSTIRPSREPRCGSSERWYILLQQSLLQCAYSLHLKALLEPELSVHYLRLSKEAPLALATSIRGDQRERPQFLIPCALSRAGTTIALGGSWTLLNGIDRAKTPTVHNCDFHSFLDNCFDKVSAIDLGKVIGNSGGPGVGSCYAILFFLLIASA